MDRFVRATAKRALNILYNAPNYRSALGAIAAAIRDELYDGDDGFDYFADDIYRDVGACDEARRLIAALKERHRPIAEYFHSCVGLRLQYRDSVIAGRVMAELRKHGIVALPIHDSFRVGFENGDQLLEAMNAALYEVSGGRADMEPHCRDFRNTLKDLTQEGLTYGGKGAWVVVVPLRPRQLDLFPSEVTISAPALSWRGGLLPMSVCQAAESKRRAFGLTQADMASMLGISRPQYTNAVRGRFGLGRKAAERLKAFVLEETTGF